MEDEIKEVDIGELKQKLRGYTRDGVEFNEPHFSQQLILREGNEEEVINHLLNPEKLVYAYQEKGKYGDAKYALYFEVSNTRTMKIPVIFDRGVRKDYM